MLVAFKCACAAISQRGSALVLHYRSNAQKLKIYFKNIK
nr:MAG TPA: hypothetical protein [Caudoviricetes sp.]